jgi:hypothetical protein
MRSLEGTIILKTTLFSNSGEHGTYTESYASLDELTVKQIVNSLSVAISTHLSRSVSNFFLNLLIAVDPQVISIILKYSPGLLMAYAIKKRSSGSCLILLLRSKSHLKNDNKFYVSNEL